MYTYKNTKMKTYTQFFVQSSQTIRSTLFSHPKTAGQVNKILQGTLKNDVLRTCMNFQKFV